MTHKIALPLTDNEAERLIEILTAVWSHSCDEAFAMNIVERIKDEQERPVMPKVPRTVNERAWSAVEASLAERPMIKEADPELERLLREEDEIEARSRVNNARNAGYESAMQDCSYRLHEFLKWLYTLENLEAEYRLAIVRQVCQVVPA